MPLFCAALVFCAVVLICFAAAGRLQQKHLLDRRIYELMPQHGLNGSAEDESDEDELLTRVQRLLGQINQKLNIKPSRQLALELVRAGISLSAGEFLILNALLGFSPLVLLGFSVSLEQCLLLAVLAALAPSVYVRWRQSQRSKQVEQQLPEVLAAIANSLKAGCSFFQAVELIARESEPPLAEEFALVNKEMSLGADTEFALENLVKRVVSDDLELVVTAVLIQRQVGGNLSEILDSIAGTIRERIRIKGEISTLTAQGRISGLVISALPFALTIFIYLLNPDYIRPLFSEPLGRAMLIVGLGGQAAAAFLIRRIVNIRV